MKKHESRIFEKVINIVKPHCYDNIICEKKDNQVIIKMYKNTGRLELYKTINITDESGRIKLQIFPERIERIVNFEELEDILIIIKKQMITKNHTAEEIQKIKEKYVAGTKIKLIKMYDLQAVSTGICGKVDFVDDIGTIHIIWENGSSLGLIVGIDEFEIVEEEKKC